MKVWLDFWEVCLQAQTFDVLDAGEDDVGGNVPDARQRVDDLADEALHLLRVGSHGVDVELVFAGDAVDLRDGVAPVEYLRRLGERLRACLLYTSRDAPRPNLRRMRGVFVYCIRRDGRRGRITCHLPRPACLACVDDGLANGELRFQRVVFRLECQVAQLLVEVISKIRPHVHQPFREDMRRSRDRRSRLPQYATVSYTHLSSSLCA